MERAQRPASLPFWHYIRARFDADAKDLFGAFGILLKDARGRATSEFFRTLVVSDPFIEVPGLKMPRARVVFLFDDKTFFRYLLPLPADDGRRQSRRDFVKDDYYDCFKEWVQRQQEDAKRQGHKTVRLTQDYLQEVLEVVPQQMRYLFLSGFIQNIVDFMNQDASEVLDSTDPVYPATLEQEEESFFISYASPALHHPVRPQLAQPEHRQRLHRDLPLRVPRARAGDAQRVPGARLRAANRGFDARHREIQRDSLA